MATVACSGYYSARLVTDRNKERQRKGSGASSCPRPFGITLLALFFAFGCCAAGLSFVLLLFPGTALDALWRLNPRARAGFVPMGSWALLLMFAVSAACAGAAFGLWKRARWGLWTAVAILTLNLAGDTANAFVGHDYRALIGIPIGGCMIAYLLANRRAFLGARD